MGTTKLGVIRSNHGTLGVAVEEVVQLLVDLLLLAVLPQQTSPQAVEYWVNTEASTGRLFVNSPIYTLVSVIGESLIGATLLWVLEVDLLSPLFHIK